MHENSSSCVESIFNIYFKINFLLSYYPWMFDATEIMFGCDHVVP